MSAVLHDPVSLVLILVGLIISVIAVVINGQQHRSAAETAGKLIYAALEGRPEEARIQARTAGRAMQPILRALSGELSPPSTRLYLQDFAWFAAIYATPVLLILRTWIDLDPSDSEVWLARGLTLFIGLAILGPVALSASLFIIVNSRYSARIIRGHCIKMVARHLKGVIDAEISEALRRGSHPRDPRGE